jgi:hypothetical protein
MKIEVKTLESFPPNSNPFHHDLVHMGQVIGKDLVMMHVNHPHQEMTYMILVDTETGQRFYININRENEETNEDSEANGS